VQSRWRSHSRLLTTIDGLFALAMALASVVAGNSSRLPLVRVDQFLETRITILNAVFAALFMAAWTNCFILLDRPQSDGMVRKLLRTIYGCGAMSLLLGLYLYLSHTTGPTLQIATIFFAISVSYKIFRVLVSTWISARDPQLVVILGSGRPAVKAWREIRTRYHFTVKLLGFVDDRPTDEMAPDVAERYLGTIDQLDELLLRNVVDELLIALPMKSCYHDIQRAIDIAAKVGVKVVCMQDMYTTGLKQSSVQNSELFNELVPHHEDYMTKQAIKRLVDVFGALFGLIVLSPLLLLVAIAVKLSSEGPVLFAQQRYGYRRRLFKIYKFRSMVKDAPAMMAQLEEQNEAAGPIFKIRNDPRVTRVGRFLRLSSLDELPQLWNVLVGQMSLVGPRPMSVRDVLLFNEATLMRRFTVKPGITGLWQVSGRSSVGFDQWIKFDFSYIDDWSLTLDFQILAKTVSVVVKRTGAV
jgi:exopolysaccharide biosynthesis polyprenyl glycosylphosphotransferase